MVCLFFIFGSAKSQCCISVSGRFSGVLLAALGLLLACLGPPLTKVMEISGIPMPLLSLLRNCDPRVAGGRARRTCGQADTQLGLSCKYTPWVINHKDYVSQVRYFLFWILGPVSVSATLATEGGWEKSKWDTFRMVRFSSMPYPMSALMQGWAGALGHLWPSGCMVVPSRDLKRMEDSDCDGAMCFWLLHCSSKHRAEQCPQFNP